MPLPIQRFHLTSQPPYGVLIEKSFSKVLLFGTPTWLSSSCHMFSLGGNENALFRAPWFKLYAHRACSNNQCAKSYIDHRYQKNFWFACVVSVAMLSKNNSHRKKGNLTVGWEINVIDRFICTQNLFVWDEKTVKYLSIQQTFW